MTITIPDNVGYVLSKLSQNGYEAFIVGGCVRDSILGREVNDYDVTTNALPQQIIDTFQGSKLVLNGLKHGTVGVICGGECIEITTYRIDGEYGDSRHPSSVTFTLSIEDDLARRDFTVNAIAYRDGEICDPFGGCADISDRIIRCVGNADKRFGEDALRIMRMMRFAAVLDFSVEEQTERSAHGLYGTLADISKERIYAEVKKLILGNSADRIMDEFEDIIRFILPHLESTKEDYKKSLGLISKSSKSLPLRLALLYKDRPCENLNADLIGLKTDREIRQNVSVLMQNRYDSLLGLPDVRRLVGKYGEELTKLINEQNRLIFGDRCDFSAHLQKIEDDQLCCTQKQLKINGGDLLGSVPKEKIGEYLLYALDGVIDEKVANEKDTLIEYIKNEKEN